MPSHHDNHTNILKALSFKWSMVAVDAFWRLTSPKGQTFVVASDSIGMPELPGEVLDALAEGSGERTGAYPTQTFTKPPSTPR